MASIHDPHKKIRTQTPQNQRKKPRLKSNENSPKKTQKTLEPQEGNRRNHESFHTVVGQILYKIVKKI
jgi:hypothetical protein